MACRGTRQYNSGHACLSADRLSGGKGMAAYSIEARKARWSRQLAGEGKPEHLFQVWYDPDAPPRPHLWPEKKAERIEWAWRLYEQRMARAEWLMDDMVPGLLVTTGTEIFAAAFGCPVLQPEDTMPYARPIITEAAQVAALRVPDISAPALAVLFEIADALRARAGNEAPLGMVDLQSPMDVAALIWDKNDFFVAMVEAPEAVRELAHKVLQLQIAFLDAWFARYGRDFIAHCPYYYIPQGITLSEDEVGIVNEAMFMEFFLPELATLSHRYGALGMHSCATARHQWEHFKKIPNLQLLNLTQPPEVVRRAYPFFADHCVQYHHGFDGPARPDQFPAGSRVVLDSYATSADEAKETVERLWTLCGRA